jgi:hypothetical protein
MTETNHSAGNGTAGIGQKPANIVWIASYPKSGNTWMRVFLWHLLRSAGSLSATGGGGFDFLRTFATTDSSRVDLFERFLGKSVGEASFDEVSAVRPRVQAAIAAAADGMIAVKSHSALGVAQDAPTIDLALMVAAIYIVRNPLDVAVSLADHFGSSVDVAIDRMGLENCMVSSDGVAAPEFWGSWSQNVGSWTGAPNPQIMPVRYEDMLSAPQLVFPAVAKFLGIQPNDEQMAAAMRASSFQRLKETEERSGFPEARRSDQRFFREGRAGGWREKLNEDQIRRLVAAHHVQMARVGYLEPGLMQYLPESAR